MYLRVCLCKAFFHKWETLLEFCLEYDINFKIFEIADDEQFKQPNISEKLKPYTTFLPLEKYWDTEYYLYRLKIRIKRAIFGED